MLGARQAVLTEGVVTLSGVFSIPNELCHIYTKKLLKPNVGVVKSSRLLKLLPNRYPVKSELVPTL